MAYFSRMDIERQEHRESIVPQAIERLQLRLDDLWDRLEMLLRICESPEWFDRYFYSDHVTEPYELPRTVQGTLEAIRQAEGELREYKDRTCRLDRWLETVRTTGATPEGQLVFSPLLFPLYQLAMQAA